MNPRNNKVFMIISLVVVVIVVLLLIFSNIFCAKKSSDLPVNNPNHQISSKEPDKVNSIIDQDIKTQLERPAKINEDINEDEEIIGLGTTQHHWKDLGIENPKISSEEEKSLYLITVEAVKAQLEYSAVKNDKFLEEVINLYLPEEFERYKGAIKSTGGYRPDGATYQTYKDEYQFYNEIKTIKFSKPRIYEGLPDRIGIINYVEFNDSKANRLTQIFILKNVNSEWKIEKQTELFGALSSEEDNLIGEIKDGK
jgi:hypothetical protein